MPVSLTFLLAALASREESSQRVIETTPLPFLPNTHEEHLARRHWVTRSASKAPAEEKLQSPWVHPTTLSFCEMTASSNCTVACIAEAAAGGKSVAVPGSDETASGSTCGTVVLAASSDSHPQRDSHLIAPEGGSTNECEVSKERE